jgi:hypothetical protein
MSAYATPPRSIDDAPAVFGELWLDQFSPQSFPSRERTAVVAAHEARITDHIDRNDRCEAALVAGHRSLSLLMRHHRLRQQQQFLRHRGPFIHLQPRIHLLHVRAGGVEAQAEVLGDFPVALAGRDQQSHLALLGR